jgi:hypothetical protein
MIQDIVPSGGNIEVIVYTGRSDSDNGTNPNYDDEGVSSDGIIKSKELVGQGYKNKSKRRYRPIIALSIGLLIGTIMSVTIFVVANVRSGSLIPTFFTSIIHEQLFCRTYPRPVPFAGKKGVAMQLNDFAAAGSPSNSYRNVPILQSLRPYWNYGWSAIRSTIQPDDIEWVPMIWGGNNVNAVRQRIDFYVVPHIQSGKVKRILGFNEPDAPSQANMTVQRALEIWPTLEYTNVSVVSPSCALPAGEWMRSFMVTATNTCKRVDWVAVHWYGSANFISFRNTIRNYYYMYGKKPIIITEFAVADFKTTTLEGNGNTREEVLSFMKRALPWLESRSWIVGYAWFPYRINDIKGWTSALYDDYGQLTRLGQYYASVRKDTPYGNQTIQW